MDFRFTAEHEKIRTTCRQLAEEFATRAAQHDREASLPLENYERLKQEGLFALTVPKELGGLGSGFLGYIVAAEELAQGCPSTAMTFNMHCLIAGMFTTMEDVPPAARARLAHAMVQEKKLVCAPISEPGATSLLAVRTLVPTVQATCVAGGYTLRGRKIFTSMLEASDYAALVAHPAEDPNPLACMFLLVPRPAPGQRVEHVWDTLDMRGTRSNDLILEDCFVPEENFIYAHDSFPTFFASRFQWAAAYMAVYIGIAAAAYRHACQVLRERIPRGFSQPMSYHPDIRRHVAEMSVDLEAARLLMYHAAWLADQEGMTPAATAAVARAKYFAGHTATRVTRSALDACGAHALFKTSPLERLYRDAASAPIMPPPGDACLSVVSMIELGLNPLEMLPPLQMPA